MTANPTTTTCPACSSTYVTALDTGNLFCAECRHEWDPAAKPEPAPAARPVEEHGPGAIDDRRELDLRDKFSTIVEVEHDDGGSGNWRVDRFTWVTDGPHTALEAENEATIHFMEEVGSEVRSARAAYRFPDVDPPTVAEIDADTARELEAFIEATDAESVAYLERLIGTGVTLDGGQRAVILGFEDDDKINVQLADGVTYLVDFNDVVRADNGPVEGAIIDVEIDDATAEVFGMASLLLACMVIEAGVASIEGEGDDAHLVPAATGWFPDDEDAVPVMETAAAGAVAMLVQTFALPRADITAMVERIRTEALTATQTEAQGHDEHTSDDDSTTAGDGDDGDG